MLPHCLGFLWEKLWICVAEQVVTKLVQWSPTDFGLHSNIQFKIMAKVGRTVVFFEIIGAKSMTVSFAESSGEAISK